MTCTRCGTTEQIDNAFEKIGFILEHVSTCGNMFELAHLGAILDASLGTLKSDG